MSDNDNVVTDAVNDILNDPAVCQKVFDTIKEVSIAQGKISEQRKHIAAIKKVVRKEYKLSMKDYNAIAKIYHKQNFNEVVEDNERIEILYERVVGKKV